MLTFAIAALPSAILFLWILVIRPYCIRYGQGYTPGCSVDVTMWIDWQTAKEIADAKGDRGMRICCTLYLTLMIMIYTPFIAAIIMAFLVALF